MLCAFLKKQQRIDAPAVTWAAAAMREDSFQGAPDPIDLRSHFERRLTLTEVFDPDTRLETTTRREEHTDRGLARAAAASMRRPPRSAGTARQHDRALTRLQSLRAQRSMRTKTL
jgi:hypothetical protein